MDEQTQTQFLEWLVDKLQVDDKDDLMMVLEEMDDSELDEAFKMFQSERKEQEVEMNKELTSTKDQSPLTLPDGTLYAKQGSKIEYLKKLQKKGV